ncbi:MAG: hypothetical protein GY782_02940 [Gammaproteobacteria bacterium]|nr:hypothetical protein [Gammaproteobacteria bacterium]
MKLAKEMWRVVIDVETDQQAWTELVSTFNATIEQLTQALGSGWKLQLKRLQQRVQNLAHRHAMHASRTGTRARRGLIDGVGQLGHYLFGLATETEIQELKAKIEENRRYEKTVRKWSKDYVAIVARTRVDVKLNRDYLHNITQELESGFDKIKWIISTHDVVHQLELIQDRQETIVDDLEHGSLTERVMPRDMLASIVGTDLPLEWYYRWIEVIPMWSKGWTYLCRLPIIATEVTLGYQLQTFPVWGPDGRAVALDVSRFAALDVQSGLVTEPKFCQGDRPKVCTPGLSRNNGCATAIIKNTQVEEHCTIIFVPVHDQTWYPLGIGEVIIVLTETTTLTEDCTHMDNEKSSLHKITLEKGTHRIRWHSGCQLSSSTESLTAVRTPRSHRIVESWLIPQGAINLVRYFANKTYPSVLPPVVPMDMEPLPTVQSLVWDDGLLDGSTVLIVCIVIMLSVALVYALYRAYRDKLRTCITGFRATSSDEDINPTAPPVELKDLASTPLYPSLSNSQERADGISTSSGSSRQSQPRPGASILNMPSSKPADFSRSSGFGRTTTPTPGAPTLNLHNSSY